MEAWAITQRRPARERIGLAGLIVVAHAFLLFQLVQTPFFPKQVDLPQPALTWLRIQLSTAPMEPVPASGTSVPVLTPAPQITPAVPNFSIAAPPSQNPAAAALNPYVSCALPDDNRLWSEDQKRCALRLWDQFKVAPARELTDEERALARKFEHELKVQNAPLLIPCFSPSGAVSVICLAKGLAQGFEANSGYADTDMRDTHRQGMPRAPHFPGMQRGLP